jgi:hypothetical protein
VVVDWIWILEISSISTPLSWWLAVRQKPTTLTVIFVVGNERVKYGIRKQGTMRVVSW